MFRKVRRITWRDSRSFDVRTDELTMMSSKCCHIVCVVKVSPFRDFRSESRMLGIKYLRLELTTASLIWHACSTASSDLENDS